MSLFFDATSTCGRCGTATAVRLAASLNADSRPDLRAAIVAGEFQAETCRVCGTRLRLPLHLSVLDMGRGNWILAEEAGRVAEWRAVEAAARAVFEQAYGPETTALAQELGRELRPRIVFGWASLREKLLCDDLGLDDVTVELAKLALLRTVPAAFDETQELRLVGAEADALHFVWVDSATEAQGDGADVPRGVVADVEAEPEAWRALRARLTEGLFVDLRRLFFA
jgi:CpXC protein